MRSLILIAFIIVANPAQAQPSVRISAPDFLQSVSNHPELRKRLAESNSVKARSNSKKELPVEVAVLELELQTYADEFRSHALLCFQNAWMLEQQINELKHYQNDVLAVKINGSDLLIKQEVLSRETQLQLFELENRRNKMVRELNALVRHEYGAQPVLPEGWVWSFNDDVPVVTDKNHYVDQVNEHVLEVKNLAESFIQINGIIALQEKLITKLDRKDALIVLNELAHLNSLKKSRWNAFEQIAIQKAELYKLGVQQSAITYPLIGSN